MRPVHLTRVLLVPPERVWPALTDPAALAAWFWPAHLAATVAADPRPGGRYRIESPAGAIAVGGEYLAVEPPSLLTFTWRWDGEPAETAVTVRLTPTGTDTAGTGTAGTGTALTLTHHGFTDEADRDNHVTGWSDCLDRLPGWLAEAPGTTV